MMKTVGIAAAALLSGTLLTLSSCYTVMPISGARMEAESAASGGSTVIVYYDAAVGTDAIERFIRKNDIEVLYRYSNIHGYALKLKTDNQRTALEKTKGVLAVQNDRVIRLD